MMPQLFDMDMMVRHDERSVVLKMEPSAGFSQVISSLYDCAPFEKLGYGRLPGVKTAHELERMLSSGKVELVDVREADERDHGYIPESLHIPYRRIGACVDELKSNGTVVTICETGSRASTAASILQAAGVDARPVLGTGVSAWRARGGQCVEFRRCGS